MKKQILIGLVSLVFLGGLLSSCSKVPQPEIDAANAAITATQAAGAEMYLPTAFTALKDSMNSVMAGIETQKSKFIKNFNDSKEGLAGVSQMANDLTTQTAAKVEELKQEIQTSLEAVIKMNESNKQLILEAPKGKEGTAALEAIKAEIQLIETSIGECNDLVLAEKYLDAKTKVLAAKEKAFAINAELMEVITKYKANVKNRR